MKFMEQVKLFIKLLFSQELLIEVAQEMQEEYEASRRNATQQQESNGHNGHDCLNYV